MLVKASAVFIVQRCPDCLCGLAHFSDNCGQCFSHREPVYMQSLADTTATLQGYIFPPTFDSLTVEFRNRQLVTEFTTVRFYDIDANHAGQRLDNYLIQCCKGVPKSKIYKIIRKGEVRVNKKRAKVSQKLQMQDRVRVPPLRCSEVDDSELRQKLSAARQTQLTQSILFEDDNYLIVNKPRDFAVHAGTGIIQGLIEQFAILRHDLDFLQLCHRLDRETTGCLVMAKNRAALLEFQRQLPLFQIKKHYLALVHGIWPENIHVIDAPLHKLGNADGDAKVVVQEGGKSAKTEIISVQTAEKASLLEVSLVTGRTHQVRVHCQHQGHSIVGDRKYGTRQADSLLGIRRNLPLGLHAAEIAFEAFGQEYCVVAPPDRVWMLTIQALGFDIAG